MKRILRVLMLSYFITGNNSTLSRKIVTKNYSLVFYNLFLNFKLIFKIFYFETILELQES